MPSNPFFSTCYTYSFSLMGLSMRSREMPCSTGALGIPNPRSVCDPDSMPGRKKEPPLDRIQIATKCLCPMILLAMYAWYNDIPT